MSRLSKSSLFFGAASAAICLGFGGGSAWAGDLAGRVTAAGSDQPLVGAQVVVKETGAVQATGSDGRFRFAALPGGTYTLLVRYAGSDVQSSVVTVPATGSAEQNVALGGEDSRIVVVGQLAMMSNSIARQRASDTIDSIVSRDAIGQFPDQNVAESTRHLPGVNVLNDQGEGRFVSVRGLDPSLNAASVNGVRLPAPEADTRQVALDVIASELIESIEIKKTLTPDMDADTIGASIEINTTKGFDRKGLFLSATVEGSYNDLNERVSPKGAVDFSVPISDTMGLSGGISYYDRTTSTDNQEIAGWTISQRASSLGVVYADTVEYRDYDVNRVRKGASLSFDWQLSNSTELYARALYSQFDDTEFRRRLVFSPQGTPISGDANTANFLSGAANSQRLRVRRDLKDRFEGQKIQSYQIGGETDLEVWKFDYKLAYSTSEEHEFNTTDPTRFERNVTAVGGLGYSFDYSNLETTKFAITAGAAGFNDPSLYNFTVREDIDGLSTDDEFSAKFDAARRMEFGDADVEFKAGFKVRLREKDYALTDNVYSGYTGPGGYTLARVTGVASYGLADIGLVPDPSLVRPFNRANLGFFTVDAATTALESNIADYEVAEDIYAGYVQAKYDNGPLMIVGGVRVEQTQDDLSGKRVEGEGPVVVTPTTFSTDYTDVLPSVNLKYEATDDIVLRGGLFASVVRPGIGQLAPRYTLNDDNEGEFGNPALDPYRAWNLDLSAEWYFDQNAVVQGGVFYKKVRDFIVTQHFGTPGTFQGVAYDEADIPMNGDEATVTGFEFNYQQGLTFLPGPLSGLLVGFNYTYTDAKGDILTSTGTRSISLPASSKNTYNAMLGYEAGPLSLRLTAAYRDEYLDELGDLDEPLTDRYVQDHLQIDASVKYRVTDRIQLYADFINLNDEPYLAFQKGVPAAGVSPANIRNRLLQFETYSWTAKAGLRFTY